MLNITKIGTASASPALGWNGCSYGMFRSVNGFWTEAIPIASYIKTSLLCCLSLALVFDTTSPSAGACAIGISSIGRPSEPRLASPRHGTLTPGRISVGRPHCLIPISVGAVTGRKYHYRLFRSLQAVCQNCFKDKFFSLCTFDVILLTDTLTICRWSWRIFLCAFPFGLNN